MKRLSSLNDIGFFQLDILDDYAIDNFLNLINKIIKTGGAVGFENEVSHKDIKSLLEKMLFEQNSFFIIGISDKKFIGAGSLIFKRTGITKHVGEIQKVMVDVDFRGRGIAKEIMEKLIDKAKEIGLESIILDVRETQITAINLYKSFGFHIVGKFENYVKVKGGCYDDYWMQKSLKR